VDQRIAVMVSHLEIGPMFYQGFNAVKNLLDAHILVKRVEIDVLVHCKLHDCHHDRGESINLFLKWFVFIVHGVKSLTHWLLNVYLLRCEKLLD
jgi:hypothetical protein